MEYILQQYGSLLKVNDLHNSCDKVSREPTLTMILVVKSYFLFGIGIGIGKFSFGIWYRYLYQYWFRLYIIVFVQY